MNAMKIVIIGTGAVASIASHFLAADKDVKELVCASNDLAGAKKFIDTKNAKIRLEHVDASDAQSVREVAKGADLVINASLPNFNLIIMEAAISVGSNYQDSCSLLADNKTAEQLQLHKKFNDADRIALVNTGVAPGVTNLLAREAADQLDSVSDIKIRLVEETQGTEYISSWSPVVVMDEFSSPPLEYRDGAFQFVEPFEDAEDYEFPEPFGKRKTFNIYGDEVSTIPLYIKVKNVNFKAGGADVEIGKVLHKLGLFSKKSILLDGNKVIPLHFFSKLVPPVPSPQELIEWIKSGVVQNAAFVSAVEVIGKKSGKMVSIRETALYPDLKQIFKKFPGTT
ncbi:saccharopine dehydrogenase NADP-binding domain-containing protein [Candidatus Woesearchaeota archaeon]|nr:saccharopine dehydrogenase NADP-binding domain-containing protein [Candidatus Woesearchaeota archaeon]